MKIAELSRRDLVDWSPTKLKNVRRLDPLHAAETPLPGTDLVCIFDDDDQFDWPLPRVIIIRDGETREFLAWSATYLPYRPLTSFTRVVERAVFKYSAADKSAHIRQFRLALVGAILGEALYTISDESTVQRHIVARSLAGASFMFARSLMRGTFSLLNQLLGDLIKDDMGIFGDHVRDIAPVQAVWRRIALVLERGVTLFGFSYEREPRRVISDLFADVRSSLRIIGDEQEDADLTKNREARVRRFERLTEELRHSRIEPAVEAMLQGFLADRIAPGTFEHGALVRAAARDAGALCWYGFFAGLNQASRVGMFANGATWRIAEEIFWPESIFDRTRADISLQELQILLKHSEIKQSISPRHISTLCIEVAPAVYTFSDSLDAEAIQSSPQKFAELGRALAQVNSVYNALAAEQQRPQRRPPKRKK